GEHPRPLARRVPGANDVDVQAVGVRCLAPRGAVEDPLPGEAVETLDLQMPPADAARQDDRARAQDVATVELHVPGGGVDARVRSRDQNLGAEPPCLSECAARKLVARHALRKSQVVLDPGGGPGLTPGALRPAPAP